MSIEASQIDLICTQCPLAECSEQSLFCAWRWAVNPNAAQLAVATVRLIPQRLTDAERSRRWRQKNRERYNEVQRESRARQKTRRAQWNESQLQGKPQPELEERSEFRLSSHTTHKLRTALARNETQMAAMIIIREDVCGQLETLAMEREQLRLELAMENTRYTVAETEDVKFFEIA